MLLKALYFGAPSTFEALCRPRLAPGSPWCLVCSICIYYCLPTFTGALSFWWMSFCFDSTINAAPPVEAAPASSGECEFICFLKFIGRWLYLGSFSSFFPLLAFALSARTGLNITSYICSSFLLGFLSGFALALSISTAFNLFYFSGDKVASYRLSSPARPRSSSSRFGYFGAAGLSIASVWVRICWLAPFRRGSRETLTCNEVVPACCVVVLCWLASGISLTLVLIVWLNWVPTLWALDPSFSNAYSRVLLSLPALIFTSMLYFVPDGTWAGCYVLPICFSIDEVPRWLSANSIWEITIIAALEARGPRSSS